jgi:hypothetical protein
MKILNNAVTTTGVKLAVWQVFVRVFVCVTKHKVPLALEDTYEVRNGARFVRYSLN